MTDLMQQLQTHAERLEADIDPVTWTEVVDRAAPTVTTRSMPGWVLAAAVAAAVVALPRHHRGSGEVEGVSPP